MAQDEVGFVTTVNNFLIEIDGLPTVKINDIVLNEQGLRGWISNLLPNHVEAFLLDEGGVKPGEIFKKTDLQLSVNLGDFLLGRTINALGVAVDGKGLLSPSAKKVEKLDKQASGISSRKFISEQFETGITTVDTLLPIGKGQRELVIGDARSGKTSLLVDIIVNQRNTNVICVYGIIGKPISDIRNLIDTLAINKALPYSVIVAASSAEPAPLIFLAPQTALAVAEYFQSKGKDVLIILDDLGNHAKIYREMSLMAGKVPGRESYPGDIFYQQAHLLERAGSFIEGGTITALPVIELNLNDFTTFIPTNLMSMTDGHLLFKSSLQREGQRPAIDISLSVTRVGSQTQTFVQKIISSKVKSILTQAAQLRTLTSFGAQLSPETQLINKQADIIGELIRQESLTFIPRQIQTTLLCLAFTPFFISKDLEFIKRNKQAVIKALSKDRDLIRFASSIFGLRNEEQLTRNLQQVVPKIEKFCK